NDEPTILANSAETFNVAFYPNFAAIHTSSELVPCRAFDDNTSAFHAVPFAPVSAAHMISSIAFNVQKSACHFHTSPGISISVNYYLAPFHPGTHMHACRAFNFDFSRTHAFSDPFDPHCIAFNTDQSLSCRTAT